MSMSWIVVIGIILLVVVVRAVLDRSWERLKWLGGALLALVVVLIWTRVRFWVGDLPWVGWILERTVSAVVMVFGVVVIILGTLMALIVKVAVNLPDGVSDR